MIRAVRKPFSAVFIVLASLALSFPAGADWKEKGSEYLRTVYKWLMLPEADATRSVETPWLGEDPVSSKAALDAGGGLVVVAGSYATVTVAYTAGRGGVAEHGGVRVAFEHGADWGRLQLDNGKHENWATLKGPDRLEWQLSADYNLGVCTLLQARLVTGELREGETVRLIMGDRTGGSLGLKVTAVSEVAGAGRVRVFEDRNGEGKFHEIPGVPELTVLPGMPDHLRVIARSYAPVGGEVDGVIHVDDQFNNVVSSHRGWFAVADAATGRRLGKAWINPEQGGIGKLEGVECREEGVLRLKVDAVGGGFSATSNPIMCAAGPDQTRVFFGSIHNHTLVSDGLNTMTGAATYARDASNLDFYANTDHAVWPDWTYDPVLLRNTVDQPTWEKTAQAVREFHRPGEFVTFLGFEWTTNTYGDKCVYFFDDRAPFRVFPADQKGLYRSLARERALIVTHTMMGVTGVRGPRWDLADPQYEKVMENASEHGVREYGGNDYPICDQDAIIPAFLVKSNLAAGVLARGLRLGFVAGADDHSGKPGSGNQGILRCGIDGLTAVRGLTLDRETIFAALERRASYATTGARMLLDFSVNGQGMGSEVMVADVEAGRLIRAEVYGEAPVKEVAVVRDDPGNPVHVWTFEPPTLNPGQLSWTDNTRLRQPIYYYLRVLQTDRHIAWSSPIWVEKHQP